MKITGIIFFVFAILNFLVAIFASANGYGDQAGSKFGAFLLLGAIGGIFYYFGAKKTKDDNDNIQIKSDQQPQKLEPSFVPKQSNNSITNNESKNLFETLKEKCNPANFMEPYDHEKVRTANEIYSKILQHEQDEGQLRQLREQASKQLGISFSSRLLKQELLELTNPKNFMDPYDAEKVKIANDYYQQIMKNGNDINELERIRDEVQLLTQFQQTSTTEQSHEHKDVVSDGEVALLLFSLSAIIIAIIVLSCYFSGS
ncbi:MAG: hypothetical protein IKX39_07720 [Muribaculaceae bacterium]|nr:hypothetical protein [Muribaculaceae bacterium]